MTQYYWGVSCIACGKLHPVKLATGDIAEQAPNVARFMIMCPTTKDDIIFESSDLIKYSATPDERFLPHSLFQ
jgi:hypothetical protein